FDGLPVATASPMSSGEVLMGRRALTVLATDLTVETPERGTIFSSASFEIGAGQTVALLGPSGIGKSTLIEVLARLRTHAGKVELAGVALEAIEEGALRRQVAVLGQRPRLFHGTIASNIRLGRPHANDREVREAAQRACVLDFA